MRALAWTRSGTGIHGAAVVAGLAVICLFAGKGVVEGLFYALEYSQDFQWSPAVLLSEGRDPYAWYLAGNAGGRILMSQEPNYLHLLYELLAPLALLSWPAAKAVWAICNLAMGVATAYLLSRDAGLRGRRQLAAIAVFLASSPFAHTLGNGQQSLLCLFALTLAWRWRAGGVGGAWIAVGATKYSFAFPIGIWWLLERRASALGSAAIVTLGAVGLFVAATGADPIVALLEPLRVSAVATRVGLADFMSFVRSLNLDPAITNIASYISGVAAAGLGVTLLWRARKRLDDADIFALLCVVSMFAFFHNLYDYVLLLPLLCRVFRWSPLPRGIALGYVGFFWFVVRFAEPWLKSSAAIGAMAVGSFVVFTLLVRLAGNFATPVSADAPSRPKSFATAGSP